MTKTKGSKKTGGRKKGTPNKITTTVRQKFEEFIQKEFPELETEFENLKTSDEYKKLDFEKKFEVIMARYSLITKMSSFVVPKKIENEIDFNTTTLIKQSQDKIN
ncbi:MAG: hypothetical protein LBB53_02995, partial [Prevotellaceae bacterium]|nr:hypothetical protein [Prevotellaceae bacterium]